jgi:predicted porin
MTRSMHKYLMGAAALALLVPATSALADPALDAVLERLDKLEKENAKLKNEIKRVEGKAVTAPKVVPAKAVDPAKPGADPAFVQVSLQRGSYGVDPVASYKDYDGDDWYFRHKPGSGLTFLTPNGEITLYGQLDVSLDVATKGIGNFVVPANSAGPPPGGTPVGKMGWQPDLSTNISFFGVRGEQKLGGTPLNFVYQLETQIDITATSGFAETNSNQSDTVKGALTSRNSFIGVSSGEWGAIKVGKTDAPYKNSTSMMNPFSGMLGDYQVIMGNTGGDNRVEFGTRLDHSIWYESPNWKGNWGSFSFAALFSPGQNRASNSDNLAAGESDCAGGNSPYSGGFGTCSDGAFSNAYSVSATYQTKIPLGGGGYKDSGSEIGVLITGAYERHGSVNRSSDLLGIFGPAGDPPFVTSTGMTPAQLALYNQDVADEDAAKIAMQLKFPTGTTVSGIYESLHRYVSSDLAFQNERQRNGTWLALTQEFTERDNVSFGWAHAFKTPGDPGQHNDATLLTVVPGGAFAPNDNAADMLTVAYKHTISPGWLWYIDYAATINGPSAHYDLGAGGRGVTIDCHDANSSPTAGGGIGSNPHCWTGGLLQGVSTGLRYNF